MRLVGKEDQDQPPPPRTARLHLRSMGRRIILSFLCLRLVLHVMVVKVEGKDLDVPEHPMNPRRLLDPATAMGVDTDVGVWLVPIT